MGEGARDPDMSGLKGQTERRLGARGVQSSGTSVYGVEEQDGDGGDG